MRGTILIKHEIAEDKDLSQASNVVREMLDFINFDSVIARY